MVVPHKLVATLSGCAAHPRKIRPCGMAVIFAVVQAIPLLLSSFLSFTKTMLR